jgi:hypothetical protein
MATGQLERPGVRVFQVLATSTPTIVRPTLGAVMIGKACQIEEDEPAGLFDNISATYSYPEKVAGATVDTASVVVKLSTADGTFTITTDPAVTIGATTVTVDADPTLQATILAQSAIAVVAAGNEFDDAAQNFYTLGVALGDVLNFIDDKDDVVGVTANQSNNLGDWIVTDVPRPDRIEVLGLTPAHIEGTVNGPFEIQLGVNDEFTVTVDGGAPITVTLSASSAALAEDIANDLNGDPSFALVAEADAYGRKVRIRSKTQGTSSTLLLGSGNANATLGFTDAGTDTGTNQAPLVAETDVEYTIVRTGTASGTILLTYKACRTDEAAELIEAVDVTDIENNVGKVGDPNNPLGFAMQLALALSGGLPVYGVITKDENTTSHQKAIDFLETEEVYAMVPLSQSTAIHALYASHVVAASQPSAKRERKVYINPVVSDFDELQASRTATAPVAGVPDSTFTDSGATFEDNAVLVGHVLEITAITGASLEIDSAELTLPAEVQIAGVTSETEIEVVGQFTVDPGNVTYSVKTKDYTPSQKATNQAAIGAGYAQQRVTMVHPDTVEVDVDGTETEVPGYFACAAIAGMRTGLSPSQGFTNLQIGGLLGVKGSNDIMTEDNLNTLAGGGVWILIQETASGPVTTRHQLTTDITDIKTREESMLTARDHFAKRVRLNLNPLIGRYNLTQKYLDNQVRVALNGVIQDEVKDRVIGKKTSITSLKILTDQPDTAEAVVNLEGLFPANFIDVRVLF